MKLRVVKGTFQHARAVADNLSMADRRELIAAGSNDFFTDIASGFTSGGRVWTVLGPGDEPLAIGGVTPSVIPHTGGVWLLTTSGLLDHQTEFLRRGRAYLDALHSIYPILGNAVDARNAVHIRWLKWMGFTFTGVTPHGPHNLPFLTFTRRLRCVNP